VDVSLDEALLSSPFSPLSCLREALLTQDLYGLLEIAVRLIQRPLAVHDSSARHLAETTDVVSTYQVFLA
jgi:hypothetical protein